jgi:hypothetical protein
MFQSPSLFDPSNKNPDHGPGIGAGFGTGVIVYVVSLFLSISFALDGFRGEGIGAFVSTNLIVNLLIDGGLIWHSLANNRKSFAQGLIICAAIAALLDSACWKIAH